jgi:hypothetical protein
MKPTRTKSIAFTSLAINVLALANLDDADLILNDSVDDAILRVVTKSVSKQAFISPLLEACQLCKGQRRCVADACGRFRPALGEATTFRSRLALLVIVNRHFGIGFPPAPLKTANHNSSKGTVSSLNLASNSRFNSGSVAIRQSS